MIRLIKIIAFKQFSGHSKVVTNDLAIHHKPTGINNEH